jgi:hypothetical protein
MSGQLPPPELLEVDPPPELELDDPVTVTAKFCVLLAPQVLMNAPVAVQVAAGDTVCSRALPEVPQPLQLQVPPDEGCGPNCTVLPVLIPTLAVCCHAPPLTRRKGVSAVAVQPPPLDEELEPPLSAGGVPLKPVG